MSATIAPTSGRTIGWRHRQKTLTDGTERPTQLAFYTQDGNLLYNLEIATEDLELDFVRGQFPVSYRDAKNMDEVDWTPVRHHKERTLKKTEDPADFDPQLLKRTKSGRYKIVQVPAEYDGLQPGDNIAMVLGGSGDLVAHALSKRGEQIGANVHRVPPFILSDERLGEKEEDAHNLALLLIRSAKLFYQVEPRDRDTIYLRQAFDYRMDAMKARIACKQRLIQRARRAVFTDPDGEFPELSIEDRFAALEASDVIYQALLKEEKRAEKDLTRAVEATEAWQYIFADIEGCGPMIAARLISVVIDIRRFGTAAKLKAYFGAHVLPDGRFPRKRRGEVANWVGEARQALYLLGDQFNRRPDSYWGQELRRYKAKFREKYPEPVKKNNGKLQYTDAHIHRMATWRTLTRFVEWLHREWWKLEQGELRSKMAA